MMNQQKNPLDQEHIFLKERIRQAKLSFDALLLATVLTGAVSFAGIYFLLSGQVSKGSLTSIGGFISNVAFVKLAKDANDRLDRVMKEAIEEDSKNKVA